jgi:alpha-tubulin suppressor-like RCC1 family protein
VHPAADARGVEAPLHLLVQAGRGHTCAVTSNGALMRWGCNVYGAVGDGTGVNRWAPVEVLASGVTAVAAGTHHTCAITASGGAICWGNNAFAQLGDGTSTSRRSPASVVGF